MLIHHYYETMSQAIEAVRLDTDDIALAEMYIQDGAYDAQIIAMLRGAGLLLATAAMTLKVAKTGVNTREQCERNREKRWKSQGVQS